MRGFFKVDLPHGGPLQCTVTATFLFFRRRRKLVNPLPPPVCV
jgi:hypothetical protein